MRCVRAVAVTLQHRTGETRENRNVYFTENPLSWGRGGRSPCDVGGSKPWLIRLPKPYYE